MKCYLSDDLASNLDDENQSRRACREPTSIKQKETKATRKTSGVEETVSECPLPPLRVLFNLLIDPISFQKTSKKQTKPATTGAEREEK